MRQKQRVFSLFLLSPSSRRAWIEMYFFVLRTISAARSPSSRRAWIEMYMALTLAACALVALLTEGVDRNMALATMVSRAALSPSSRRAWIEIL